MGKDALLKGRDMMTEVAIYQYGVGNLFSLRTALRREGVRSSVTKSLPRLREADAVLLPGVGGFGEASKNMKTDDVHEIATSGKPVVGICLGLQLMLRSSEEAPGRGLGLIPGRTRRLPRGVKVPHIGWNTVQLKGSDETLEGVKDGDWVYYVHSYYPETVGPWVVATTKYAVEYPAVVRKDGLVGTQFHPEKSGQTGRTILRNIVRMIRR
jgi:imidazole glycerol-phosphate synthase subunit HisH